MGTQQLHRHQTDQPQPGHYHRFAEGGPNEPYSLEGDRADHRKRRLLIGNEGGDSRTEVGWNRDHLGMFAVRGHPVTRCKTAHPASRLHHYTDIAITEWQRLIKLVEYRLDGRHQTVGLDLVQNHAHLVGLLTCLLDPASLAELHEHTLRANGDQGHCASDQYLPVHHHRAGDLGNLGLTCFKRLQNLFHDRLEGPVNRLCSSEKLNSKE
ncbi:hypothetical protein [Accumulibacter sp.]|uniref:hypothetical protein n=1 Tax=Accumulibacter sp. TaxID=2053492 RepID=UPI002590765E|nr:hypothetical protein [Accumulibacter sp.]